VDRHILHKRVKGFSDWETLQTLQKYLLQSCLWPSWRQVRSYPKGRVTNLLPRVAAREQVRTPKFVFSFLSDIKPQLWHMGGWIIHSTIFQGESKMKFNMRKKLGFYYIWVPLNFYYYWNSGCVLWSSDFKTVSKRYYSIIYSKHYYLQRVSKHYYSYKYWHNPRHLLSWSWYFLALAHLQVISILFCIDLFFTSRIYFKTMGDHENFKIMLKY
jgi:hypothetical protein